MAYIKKLSSGNFQAQIRLKGLKPISKRSQPKRWHYNLHAWLKEIRARMVKANDPNCLSESVRVWTYLAKTRTKGMGSLNTRDFSISQFSKIA